MPSGVNRKFVIHDPDIEAYMVVSETDLLKGRHGDYRFEFGGYYIDIDPDG